MSLVPRWLGAAALCVAASAQAHIASNGFLSAAVHGQRLDGSIELAVRDVELAIVGFRVRNPQMVEPPSEGARRVGLVVCLSFLHAAESHL